MKVWNEYLPVSNNFEILSQSLIIDVLVRIKATHGHLECEGEGGGGGRKRWKGEGEGGERESISILMSNKRSSNSIMSE